MPTAKIQTPEGRIVTLEVPEGATQQQILEFVQSQDLQSVQPAEAPVEQPQDERSLLSRAATGVEDAARFGLDTVGTAIGGATALVDQLNPFTDNDPQQLIDAVRDKFSFDPITEGSGAGIQQLGKTLEPIAPIMEAVQQFKDKAGDQGLDLTGSPAFATFVNMIPDLAAELAGAGAGKRVATSAANAPAVSQAKRTVKSTVDAAEDATGIRQLTSDLVPPETRLGKLFQSQGELVAGFQRKGQQAQRVKAVENLAEKFDIVEGVGFESKIVKGLKDSIQSSKAAIGKLYDESTAKLDQLGSVPLTKTKELAEKVIAREASKGTLGDAALIDDMQRLATAPDDLTFEMIKEIRSGVGANLEKVKRGAPVQGNSDAAILKRTYAKLSDDMTAFAEKADPELTKNWKKANKVVSDFATSANKTGAKSIIRNGDTTPEVVDQLLFSGKNSDVEFLAKNLDKAGLKAAQQRVLQRAFDKSSIDGDDINPDKFLTQLNKNRNQIGKLFNPEERKAIFALRDQLKSTKRAQQASVATPTGQQLSLAAAVAVPPALIPGALQGIIESKPIRNLIIKRKAAKTAKARESITKELEAEIRKAQLTGAALVGATQQEQQQ
jgi:hypothetical protein